MPFERPLARAPMCAIIKARTGEMIIMIELKAGQKVRAFSKRWTPDGWEPVQEIATVVDPCVQGDPVYKGDVELAIEGILNRVFVDRASVEPLAGSA